MPQLIAKPAIILAAGNKPKRIEEYVGRVNSGDEGVSVARMVAPEGWVEPGQSPAFQEITVVLEGMLRVEHRDGALDVRVGQAVVAQAPRPRGDLLGHGLLAGRHARRRVGGVWTGTRGPVRI